MHLLIASFICYILLFTNEYARGEKCDNYEQNVPVIAQKALVDAINEWRNNLSIPTTIEYDDKLAQQACQSVIEGSVALEGKSVFEKNWNETLKKAVMSNNNGVVRIAEKIGCQITLKTSTETGLHHVNLYCLLGNKNEKPLIPSSGN